MPLIFFVNGKKVVEDAPDPEHSLLHYLRNVLHLCGSKEGCGSGGCGACTVMLSAYNHNTKKITHRAVLACLVPVCGLHARAVTTVEGIGSTRSALHPVQDRLARGYGSQCGFCSPGMVMSMYSLLRSQGAQAPSQQQIQDAMQGNLCRCTGYRPILQAFNTFSQEFQCSMGENCCRNAKPTEKSPQWGTPCCYDDYDATQEPIFPPELMINESLSGESLCFRSATMTWYRPASLQILIELKQRHPAARVVAGNTMLGQAYHKHQTLAPIVLGASHLEDLQHVSVGKDGIDVGAAVTIQQLRECLLQQVQSLPDAASRFFRGLLTSLQVFSGQQIRNMATVGGCISAGWNPSDLNTALSTLPCTITAIDEHGKEKCIPLSGKWPKEGDDFAILTKLSLPFSTEADYFHTYKQTRRKECDTAVLNAAFRLTLHHPVDEDTDVIADVTLGFAGMGLDTMTAKKTMAALVGKAWTQETMTLAMNHLKTELLPNPDASWVSVDYIHTVAAAFLLRFFVSVAQQREIPLPAGVSSMASDTSYSSPDHVQLLTSPPEEGSNDCLYRPVAHESAYLHATGEAQYLDDITPADDELYLGLVLSSLALGEVASVDWDEALSCAGVVDKVDHTDVPGTNRIGIFCPEQEVFCSQMVVCEGQIIGGVVATSKAKAQRAAHKVKINYKASDVKPCITIQDAISTDQYHGAPKVVSAGDLSAAMAAADHVMDGVLETGAQDHFYLEPMACIVRPAEKQGLHVIITSHSLNNVQAKVSSVLAVPMHKVKCETKRLGGSFGGKDNSPIFLAAPVAVAANKVQRPVRCVLDRSEHMRLFGGRDPCRYEYRVGFTAEGRFTALDVKLYSDVGYTMDVSPAILSYEVDCLFSVYQLGAVRVEARMCKTNTRSATSFRGFGMLPPMLNMELILTHIAHKLHLPQRQVRELNFLEDGSVRADKGVVKNWTLKSCWDKVIEQSDYTQQLDDVQRYNRENVWKKRGISIVPSSIPVGGIPAFMQTGAALVNIFTDGSVLVASGAVEMGQGIHTKLTQIASHVLGVPMSLIMTEGTSTYTLPNVPPTIGGMTTDYTGFAVKSACESLLSRLAPFKEKNPDAGWKAWVEAAYFQQVNLSATGFYARHDDGYNPWSSAMNYSVQGSSVSVVEVDCMSGEHTLLSTHIVMDLGSSISPAIDVGQIEGGFAMGYGWLCLEEVHHNPDSGALLTTGPSQYKVPTVGSLPKQFHVTLLSSSTEPRAVYSAKSTGETPMFLSASVFLALQHAISAARLQKHLSPHFPFYPPASTQCIKTLCSGGGTNMELLNE